MADGNTNLEFNFVKAERKGITALVLLFGKTGCGKTYSALRLAMGLDPHGKIGFLDSEAGRGKHYADKFAYYYAEIDSPYSPQRYQEAVARAKEQGVTTLIIDSISHVQEGLGGLIDMAENSDVRGDSFAKWNKPKAAWKKSRDYMLRCGINLIFCARAKDPLEPDAENSRKMKRGEIIPIIPRDFPYEVTVSIGLDAITHELIPVKLSNELAAAFPLDQYISENAGSMLRDWLDGKPLVDKAFEQLKEDGKKAARQGTLALKGWWSELDERTRRRLRDYLEDELKPLAAKVAPASGADDKTPDTPARGERSSAPSEPEREKKADTKQADDMNPLGLRAIPLGDDPDWPTVAGIVLDHMEEHLEHIGMVEIFHRDTLARMQKDSPSSYRMVSRAIEKAG